MLSELKSFSAGDRNHIDEILALRFYGAGLVQTYGEFKLPVPEWLTDAMRTIDKEIKSRTEDSLRKELKSLELKQRDDMTVEDRRTDRAERIAALKAQLGEQ